MQVTNILLHRFTLDFLHRHHLLHFIFDVKFDYFVLYCSICEVVLINKKNAFVPDPQKTIKSTNLFSCFTTSKLEEVYQASCVFVSTGGGGRGNVSHLHR